MAKLINLIAILGFICTLSLMAEAQINLFGFPLGNYRSRPFDLRPYPVQPSQPLFGSPYRIQRPRPPSPVMKCRRDGLCRHMDHGTTIAPWRVRSRTQTTTTTKAPALTPSSTTLTPIALNANSNTTTTTVVSISTVSTTMKPIIPTASTQLSSSSTTIQPSAVMQPGLNGSVSGNQ